jgi:hypothetical protein
VEDSGAPVTTTMVPSGPDFVPGNIQGGFARLLGHTRERRLARPAGALGCCSPCCGLVGLVRAIPRRSSRRQSVKRRRRRSSLSLHCVSPSPAPIALAPRDGRSRSAAFAQLAPARVATGSGERFPCCPHDFGSEFCHLSIFLYLPSSTYIRPCPCPRTSRARGISRGGNPHGNVPLLGFRNRRTIAPKTIC